MWWQEAEGARNKSPPRRACDDRDCPQQQLRASKEDAQASIVQSPNNQVREKRLLSIYAADNMLQKDRAVSRDTARNETSAAEAASTETWEQKASNRNEIDRNWSARIRASIARLIEIDGVSLDSESYDKLTGGHVTRGIDQAFHAKVSRLQASSKAAHKEYFGRLHDVHSTSMSKKMRITTQSSSSLLAAEAISSHDPPKPSRSSHAALDTLAVAASTETFENQKMQTNSSTFKSKKNTRSIRQRKSLPLRSGSGTAQNPVQVHDPRLTRAVDKLTDNLTQLLDQVQATSDAVTAEPILAAAAAIALEATEMRRCEDVALARMVEIEEHRQQIMQGLLEYARRKDQRSLNESRGNGPKPSSATISCDSPHSSDAKAKD